MKQVISLVSLLGFVMAGACDSSSDTGGAAGSGGVGAPNGGKGGGGAGGTSSGGRAGSGGGTQAGMGGDVPIAGESPGGMGGTGIGCSSDSSQLTGATFNVELPFDDPFDWDAPSTFVFHFDETSPGEFELLIGSRGQAFRGKVVPKGNRLVVEKGLRLRDQSNDRPWSAENGITIENLSLCFHQAMDSPMLLDGVGKVLIVRNADDYDEQFEESISFTSALSDMTAPTLPPWTVDPLAPQSWTVDPLARQAIRASEPLKLGAVAALDDAAQTQLSTVEQAGTVVAFRSSRVLPLGLSAKIGADARDLVGNRLVTMATLQTKADPGVQALDGFESELRVANYQRSYQALLVDGDRALEGAHSLEVPAGAVAVLHLMRPSVTAKHVLFDLKPDIRSLIQPASFVLRAGVVGGSEIVEKEIVLDPKTIGYISEDGSAGAGGSGPGEQVNAVDLELSEPGDDILLEIMPPLIEESAPSRANAIIDRLRIE